MVNANKKVTVIPATINPRTHLPEIAVQKRRVAGYARVSTDKDEQFTSYEAQVQYYTDLIRNNSGWEFVKVYTDEGISGLNMKNRDGFKEMIADALAGKIDLIITKSVSRFARNTVDSLSTIRELKAHNVECFFEKENIYTFDGKGELLITIMSSLAQEESRSISENVTWGHHRRFEEGRVSFAYSSFLGYDRNPGEEKCLPPVINPEQAEIVKRIYRDFMAGKTAWMIAKELTADGIKTPRGKDKWPVSTLESILTNEKYKGAAILQKRFTTDFLTKTMKVNEGEVPQYYVENSHEAIIQPEEWEDVQKEIARRRSLGRRYSGSSILGARIVCGDCGAYYGPKVWNSNTKYRHRVWQCNNKFKNKGHICGTPHFTEAEIKARFVTAFNRLLKRKSELIANAELARAKLTDDSVLSEERKRLERELEDLAELTRRCITENARKALDQDEFNERYRDYEERFKRAQTRAAEIDSELLLMHGRADAFDTFIRELKRQNGCLAGFDDRIWQVTLGTATVHSDGRIVFRFLNGTEIVIDD